MKPKLLYVMPECFVDTNLIEYLLDSSVNHQHCCSKVVGTMKEKFADEFAIGIIDRDKVEMGYLKECDMLAQKGHLTIYKHKTLPHYLITIAPDAIVLATESASCSSRSPGSVISNFACTIVREG